LSASQTRNGDTDIIGGAAGRTED